MTTPSNLEALLTENDVARITGLSVASVRRWRLLRQGPRYIKIGAAVRYRPQDVAQWLETSPTGGGAPTGPPRNRSPLHTVRAHFARAPCVRGLSSCRV